jgi:phage terminase large subunit
LLKAIEASPQLQRAARAHLKADTLAFIRDWCFTYDPRLARPGSDLPPELPLHPFDVQAELVEWLDERLELREDGLVEKSRDMGFTWIVAAWSVHKWLFIGGVSIGFGSRKAELVDTLGNLDSILEKCRFIIEHLPPFLKPRDASGRPWDKTNGEHSKLKLLRNPSNGATIAGEGGAEIGRGGRKTIYIVDEAASLENAEETEAALSQTTEVRIYGSSAKGMGNLFYKKRTSGDVKVFTMKWTRDPRKDQAWYEEQKRRFRAVPWIVPQELDIDYSAGVEGVAIPGKWVQAAQRWTCPEAVWRAFAPVAALDVADGGGDANVLKIMQGPKVHALGEAARWYEGTALQTALTARRFLDGWRSPAPDGQRVSALIFDANGIGAAVAGYFAQLHEGGAEWTAPPSWDTIPFKGGGGASNEWWDGAERYARDLFANARAESWWRLRRRLEKTYEVMEGIAQHPPAECLDLPEHENGLAAQLSAPRYSLRLDDKILLESKADMKRRGVASPDEGDALTMADYAELAHSAPFIGR